jgi:hypothetical protein
MKTILVIAALSACAALASPAIAQEQAAAPPKPAMSVSMPMDCPMMAKADQGGTAPSHEMSMGKDMKCAAHGKDTAPKAKAKAKPAHDHAKFHKNQ